MMRLNVHAADPHVAVIIPARLAATRLPGKPLAIVGDAPMIVQVMRRVMQARFGAAGEASGDSSGDVPVIVACDDEAIANAVRGHGGEAVLTRGHHPSGSDRVFEALEAIDPQGHIEVVINVQGDMPEVDAGILPGLVACLKARGADMATPLAPARPDEIPRSQVVKAVATFPEGQTPGSSPGNSPENSTGRVLYFSRHAIPHGGDHTTPIWHHIGIYAWRRAALARFVSLPPSPLEKVEGLEQLRALEDGMTIAAHIVDTAPGGIDTPEDLAALRQRWATTTDTG